MDKCLNIDCDISIWNLFLLLEENCCCVVCVSMVLPNLKVLGIWVQQI